MSSAKFAIGKLAVIDAPRSIGGRVAELKGTKVTVKGSRVTDDGRIYSVIVNNYVNADDIETIEVKEDWLARAGILAQSNDVKFLPFIQVLKACSVYRIPVFQRRYCWHPPQWRLLWKDIEKVRDNPDQNNHSLGRLMLMEEKSQASRLVLDGQQRLTTLILLLAALCDRLEAIGEEDSVDEYRVFCSQHKLLPTMFDRPDFVKCISNARPSGDSQIIRAKCFFADLAETLEGDSVEEMIDAALNRLSYTAFVVKDAAGMQSIFEKMAFKQEMLDRARDMGCDLYSCIECYASGDGGKQTNATHWGPDGERLCSDCAKAKAECIPMTPGIPMSPVDLIRNFVFDHYSGDDEMKAAYTQYWGPMEISSGADTASIEAALSQFLEAQGFRTEKRWDLSKSFESWWGKPEGELSPEQYANGRLGVLLADLNTNDVVAI